jgi:hypothetical protein
MDADEVKEAPCEDCVITLKSSAVAYFVADGSDWSIIKKGLIYDTNDPTYIKFKVKNNDNWVGRGLELL